MSNGAHPHRLSTLLSGSPSCRSQTGSTLCSNIAQPQAGRQWAPSSTKTPGGECSLTSCHTSMAAEPVEAPSLLQPSLPGGSQHAAPLACPSLTQVAQAAMPRDHTPHPAEHGHTAGRGDTQAACKSTCARKPSNWFPTGRRLQAAGCEARLSEDVAGGQPEKADAPGTAPSALGQVQSQRVPHLFQAAQQAGSSKSVGPGPPAGQPARELGSTDSPLAAGAPVSPPWQHIIPPRCWGAAVIAWGAPARRGDPNCRWGDRFTTCASCPPC